MGTRGTPEIRAKKRPCRENLESFLARHSRRPRFRRQPSRQYKLALPDCSELRRAQSFSPTGSSASRSYHAPLWLRGCFLAGLKALPVKGEPYGPSNLLLTSLKACRPVLSWISPAVRNARRRAILAYRSQFRPAKSERKQRVLSRNRRTRLQNGSSRPAKRRFNWREIRRTVSPERAASIDERRQTSRPLI